MNLSVCLSNSTTSYDVVRELMEEWSDSFSDDGVFENTFDASPTKENKLLLDCVEHKKQSGEENHKFREKLRELFKGVKVKEEIEEVHPNEDNQSYVVYKIEYETEGKQNRKVGDKQFQYIKEETKDIFEIKDNKLHLECVEYEDENQKYRDDNIQRSFKKIGNIGECINVKEEIENSPEINENNLHLNSVKYSSQFEAGEEKIQRYKVDNTQKGFMEIENQVGCTKIKEEIEDFLESNENNYLSVDCVKHENQYGEENQKHIEGNMQKDFIEIENIVGCKNVKEEIEDYIEIEEHALEFTFEKEEDNDINVAEMDHSYTQRFLVDKEVQVDMPMQCSTDDWNNSDHLFTKEKPMEGM